VFVTQRKLPITVLLTGLRRNYYKWIYCLRLV